MAAKPVEIHPAALAELKSTLTWYLERSKTAALRFAAELDRAIDLVIESPGRWPSGEHSTRKFVLQRFPFAIIYRENRRSFKYWPSRMGIGDRGIGNNVCDGGNDRNAETIIPPAYAGALAGSRAPVRPARRVRRLLVHVVALDPP